MHLYRNSKFLTKVLLKLLIVGSLGECLLSNMSYSNLSDKSALILSQVKAMEGKPSASSTAGVDESSKEKESTKEKKGDIVIEEINIKRADDEKEESKKNIEENIITSTDRLNKSVIVEKSKTSKDPDLNIEEEKEIKKEKGEGGFFDKNPSSKFGEFIRIEESKSKKGPSDFEIINESKLKESNIFDENESSENVPPEVKAIFDKTMISPSLRDDLLRALVPSYKGKNKGEGSSPFDPVNPGTNPFDKYREGAKVEYDKVLKSINANAYEDENRLGFTSKILQSATYNEATPATNKNHSLLGLKAKYLPIDNRYGVKSNPNTLIDEVTERLTNVEKGLQNFSSNYKAAYQGIFDTKGEAPKTFADLLPLMKLLQTPVLYDSKTKNRIPAAKAIQFYYVAFLSSFSELIEILTNLKPELVKVFTSLDAVGDTGKFLEALSKSVIFIKNGKPEVVDKVAEGLTTGIGIKKARQNDFIWNTASSPYGKISYVYQNAILRLFSVLSDVNRYADFIVKNLSLCNIPDSLRKANLSESFIKIGAALNSYLYYLSGNTKEGYKAFYGDSEDGKLHKLVAKGTLSSMYTKFTQNPDQNIKDTLSTVLPNIYTKDTVPPYFATSVHKDIPLINSAVWGNQFSVNNYAGSPITNNVFSDDWLERFDFSANMVTDLQKIENHINACRLLNDRTLSYSSVKQFLSHILDVFYSLYSKTPGKVGGDEKTKDKRIEQLKDALYDKTLLKYLALIVAKQDAVDHDKLSDEFKKLKDAMGSAAVTALYNTEDKSKSELATAESVLLKTMSNMNFSANIIAPQYVLGRLLNEIIDMVGANDLTELFNLIKGGLDLTGTAEGSLNEENADLLFSYLKDYLEPLVTGTSDKPTETITKGIENTISIANPEIEKQKYYTAFFDWTNERDKGLNRVQRYLTKLNELMTSLKDSYNEFKAHIKKSTEVLGLIYKESEKAAYNKLASDKKQQSRELISYIKTKTQTLLDSIVKVNTFMEDDKRLYMKNIAEKHEEEKKEDVEALLKQFTEDTNPIIEREKKEIEAISTDITNITKDLISPFPTEITDFYNKGFIETFKNSIIPYISKLVDPMDSAVKAKVLEVIAESEDDTNFNAASFGIPTLGEYLGEASKYVGNGNIQDSDELLEGIQGVRELASLIYALINPLDSFLGNSPEVKNMSDDDLFGDPQYAEMFKAITGVELSQESYSQVTEYLQNTVESELLTINEAFDEQLLAVIEVDDKDYEDIVISERKESEKTESDIFKGKGSSSNPVKGSTFDIDFGH